MDYLAALASDGARIASVAPEVLDRRVPGCPEWTVRRLVEHLGGVYSWATMVVQTGGERPSSPRAKPPSGDDELMGWFTDLLQRVEEELRGRDPAAPAWTFTGGVGDVAWWRRRQAQETAVHRWDVEAAAGHPTPIPAELAADGVDEFLTVFLPGFLERRPVGDLRGTLHLHATDTPGEWWLDLDSPRAPARREHAKADTAIRGPASGLDLFLWNRLGAKEAGLDAFGDQTVVEALRQITL